MAKGIIRIAVAAIVLTAGSAAAKEFDGVKIYPGAKLDEQSTKAQNELLRSMGGGTGVCHRTKDAVPVVAGFYQKDGFKIAVGQVTQDGARLQKGDTLSITIMYMKPLDNTFDTRICISKR